jgi:hypothetical protein
MTSYKVQAYLDKTADWDTVASFKPNYRFGMMRLGRWPWWKHPIGIATNFVAAEKEALAKSIALGKKLRKAWNAPTVRVIDVTWQDGKVLLKLQTILKRQ